MKKEEFYYKSEDGKTDIHAVKWLPDTEPKAILQIAHGVTEYIERYEELAKYFTNKGFIVCGNDHIGHGKSIAKDGKKMYFGKKGSWNWAVKDINQCQKIIMENYTDLPYYMLGFSLGSFLLRTYLIDYETMLDKAIIMGTGTVPKMQIKLAEFIVNNDTKIDNFGNSVISIPILGTVKAGYDYLTQENWIGTIGVETSLVGNVEDYFALRVHGDSMSPSLIENDIVIIKKQNDFENGDIVVAIINDNEVTIKKGRKNKAGIYLQPLNTAYEPLIFTNEEIKNIPILIVGVVKQLKREF